MENQVEDSGLLTLKSPCNETDITWRQVLEWQQSQVETLEEKLLEVKANTQYSEDAAKSELEFLWCRVKTTEKLIANLKSEARIMADPHLTYTSFGIKYQEGVGFIDKCGIPLAGWSKDVDLSSFESSDEETQLAGSINIGSIDANDGAYISDILKSVHIVTNVMESLVKRVIMAETEAASEKEKVKFGLEEIEKKTLQIETMSAKVEEMEKFAVGTNSILNEMWQKVEDMVQETSRQRQRAAESEQELCHVKRDFESLRSYVSSLISVRETLLLSEKQFQTIEKHFDRLIAKTTHLENEKMQKEAEVQKLMEENVSLRAQLDKKETQLLAINEQCKFMALNNSSI
ncbi:cilia- and flagella-associated protein 57 [Phoenix dactylifera]|uniref:Cilia- and flagella-associated protein 57 n=1 Tax=Phoenix dactylifera TaxID=42345 RepID=A0A8B8ZBE5_PHODC|nr:cilia- and flagella-associated protein 57 [Phoenix dactylifera]XP_038971401.1 cilia- and flagella-associated protein 57 [Phoenix dactylifera]XP_038971402.1 cilia- and flagella-associated protein 57 [Phoenix dactylifera]XP_038971403.1 cilia- and flagella-associated protein 57 [Phoenix dactylifera]XP_038971404.1 cilia- and flagella-associated protein 57 [Phoenix dactylifera]